MRRLTALMDVVRQRVKGNAFATTVVVCLLVTYWGWFIGFACLALLQRGNATPMERAGQFGDVFGAMNALFSGVAFLVLLVTVRHTQEQVELQRQDHERAEKQRSEEAAARREESEARREESEARRLEVASRKAETLERHFFVLLDICRGARDELSFQLGTHRYSGRDTFGRMLTLAKGKSEWKAKNPNSEAERTQFAREVFDRFHIHPQCHLGIYEGYYRTLASLLLFCEENGITRDHLFFRVIMGFMSDTERVLLAYYSTLQRLNFAIPTFRHYEIFQIMPEPYLLEDGDSARLSKIVDAYADEVEAMLPRTLPGDAPFRLRYAQRAKQRDDATAQQSPRS